MMSTGVCILAMCVVLLVFVNCVGTIGQKIAVGQIARKYILRMETVGYLTPQDKENLEQELQELVVENVDLSGTTMAQVEYGYPITLLIQGTLKGGFSFVESRVSTAKN